MEEKKSKDDAISGLEGYKYLTQRPMSTATQGAKPRAIKIAQ